MHPHDSEQSRLGEVEAAEPDRSTGGGPRSPSLVRMALLATLAGLVAGVLAWLGGEKTYREFTPTPELARAKEKAIAVSALAANDPKIVEEEDRQIKANEARNLALSAGLLGALVGLALGLAGGIAARSFPRTMKSALLGIVVGAVLGGAVPWVALPLYYRLADPASSSLAPALLLHGSLWTPAGVAGGLALGIALGGTGRAIRALIGGVIGAWLGTLVYEMAGALAFPPTAQANLPIPMSPSARLLSCVSVALLTALVATAAAQDPAGSRAARPAPRAD